MATGTDVAVLIHQDHEEVEALFSALESGTGDRAELLKRLVTALSVHAAAEEQVVYPVERKAAPTGEEKVGEAIDEHQVIKDNLVVIDGGDADSPEVAQALATVMATVRHHVEEEEGELLIDLRAQVGEDRMLELGEAFEKAKKGAPTHPHPHAPSSGIGATIAGAAAKPIDKVRDKLTGKD